MTGDQKYIDEFEDGTSKLGAYEDRDIATTMRGFFNNQNTKKSGMIQLQWICHSVNFKLYEI